MQLAAVVDDARYDDQVAAGDAAVVVHLRAAVAAILHVGDPRVLGQQPVERPHQVAAEQQRYTQPRVRVPALNPCDQLGGQVHLQGVELQILVRLGNEVAARVDLVERRHVLADGRGALAQRAGGFIVVEIGAVLGRPDAVGVGLRIGLDHRAQRLFPDVQRRRVTGRHGHPAVALVAVALARRDAVVDPGALRGQVGRNERQLARGQPDLHAAPVRIADDLAQERDGDGKRLVLGADLPELLRAQPLVREALPADADLGTGTGGSVHAAAPGAAVPADRQVAGLPRGGELAAHALMEHLDPRRSHPPVELQDVHLHFCELIDQAAVVLHAHVPSVGVPDVHAAELARGSRRHVQLRQLQAGRVLGNDVAGELEHHAQPLQ